MVAADNGEFKSLVTTAGSFLILDETGRILGVSINYDFSEKIDLPMSPGIFRYVVEITQQMEGTIL